MIYAVQICRRYLEGEQFTIVTDHAALRLLTEINDPSGTLMRWPLCLLDFDYEILYLKGWHRLTQFPVCAPTTIPQSIPTRNYLVSPVLGPTRSCAR